ncbi:hypothetical protein ACLB2K_074624 [Fragaria x ananassa]
MAPQNPIFTTSTLAPQKPLSTNDQLKPSTAVKLFTAKKFYGCSNLNHRGFITDDPKSICPLCSTHMTTAVSYVPPPTAGPCFAPLVAEASPSKMGYVKDTLTYLVMDDLDVKPLASIISNRERLMKAFDLELEEKVVHLGMDEVAEDAEGIVAVKISSHRCIPWKQSDIET